MNNIRKWLALLLTAALLLTCFPGVSAAEMRGAEMRFTDVPVTDWYCADVSYAYFRGLVSGVSDTEFAPLRTVTRAEFVTILGRMLMPSYYQPSALTPEFSDVEPDTWYTRYVLWAAENGIVAGTGDGTFSPNAGITRQDMAAILYRSEQRADIRPLPYVKDEVVFTDAGKIADYAKDAITALQRQGLLYGDENGNVNPRGKLTRAEGTAMVSRFHAAVNGHTHNYVLTGRIAATCMQPGYDSYACTCGSYYGNKTANALGHNYVQTAFNSQTWQHTYTCTRCGASYQTPLPTPVYRGDSLLKYSEMKQYITKLAEMYPDIIAVGSAGKSVRGLELTVVTLGRGSRYIFLNGNIHAREYITTNYLIDVIDEYAYAYVTNGKIGGFDIRPLLDQFTLVFLPCSNPDGRAIAIGGDVEYKANYNGVDLNRNFPIHWVQYDDDGSYGGPSAGSEPETQAIMRVLRSYPFELVLDCHTAGNVIYYTDAGCTQEFSNRSRALADELASYCGYTPTVSTTGAGLGNYSRNKGAGCITFTIEMWPTLEHPIDCSGYYTKIWNRINSLPAAAMNYLLTVGRGTAAEDVCDAAQGLEGE